MRLPEENIKQAILHPDSLVRTRALHYFSRSFSHDVTVMPLVIAAVEKLGRESSVHLVGEGEDLPQTECTIQWCLEELRQDFGEQNETLDDFRFALSKLLASAHPSLTLARQTEILELPHFLPQLGSTLSERIHLFGEDTESLWNKLFEFCERENEKEYLCEMDLPHANRLVEALGRGGDEVANRVLTMLREEIGPDADSPRAFMQGFVLRLAGELRLTAAVPRLLETLKQDDEWFNEECQRALIKIGGDEVADALVREFPSAAWHFRLHGSGVLEQLHTEGVVQKCIEFFEDETDETIRTCLGQAALAQFDTAAIEPVRQFILTNKLDPEILDLRENLVAASTALGIEFPEYADWKENEEDSQTLRRQLFAAKYGSVNETSNDWNDATEDDGYRADEGGFPESASSPSTIYREETRIGRNDPCPCGSGKKYKKCCLNKFNGDPLLN